MVAARGYAVQILAGGCPTGRTAADIRPLFLGRSGRGITLLLIATSILRLAGAIGRSRARDGLDGRIRPHHRHPGTGAVFECYGHIHDVLPSAHALQLPTIY